MPRPVNYTQTISSILILTALLSACVASPPSQPELAEQALTNAVQPSQWRFAQTPGEFDAAALGFSLPPPLIELIKEAQLHNPDLRIAAARVAQAQAAITLAGASLAPSIALGAQAGNSALPSASLTMEGLALVVDWEIDIWGKTRSAKAAARANSLAEELDALYARQSLAASVVKAWLAAVEAQQQIALGHELLTMAEEQLKLMQIGQKVGRDSRQDLFISQLAVNTYRSQILQSEQASNAARRALEILLGRYPDSDISVSSYLPAAPLPIPAGLPSDLLARRPDLRAAEQRFQAAFYQVEAAKKARLPSISLTGGLAVIDDDLLQLQEDLDNPVWGLKGTLLAPLFTNGALSAQIEIRTQQQQESTALYAKTLLNALSEIEGGLFNERNLAARYELMKAQVSDQERILEMERVQVKVGSSDSYQLFQQQMSLGKNQLALLRIHNERLIQRVNLHLALGGLYPI